MPLEQITAPWDETTVAALNTYQRAGDFHPFTCPYGHRPDTERVLVATLTEAGWVCPDPHCDYTQDWAHAFMAGAE